MDNLYGLSPEAYLKLDIVALPPEDLKELAYYLWCCFEEDTLLMQWRETVLLPILYQRCPEPADSMADEILGDDEH